jgi:hypothetical protein
MKYIILLLLLPACTQPVSIKPTWPEVPLELQTECSPLNQLDPSKDKMSDVLSNVVDNYSLYHICKVKVEAWNNWYNSQKKIYEDIK